LRFGGFAVVYVAMVDSENTSVPVWMGIIILGFIFRGKDHDVAVPWYAWIDGILRTPHIVSRVVETKHLVTVDSVVGNNDIATILG
jgi:hypothetical protein